MRAFFSDFEKEAKKVSDSVNTFFEGQHKKFTDDLKETRRNLSNVFSFVPSDNDSGSHRKKPDEDLSVPSTIARYGYLCETHTIVSQGYILKVHRIPSAKNSDCVSPKTVYFQHGFLASSADWILNGPEKALAYVLADAGYDVWLGNIRGNQYSREHAWLNPNSKAYWNFSWHDVAVHDVPAIIDYILKVKGVGTKITYIGHSMGTTILFAMLTLRPEYNNILSAGFALAPVVFLSDVKNPTKGLAPLTTHAANMDMLVGNYEFIPQMSPLAKFFGKVDNANYAMCKSIIFSICGTDEKQFNKDILPVFLSNLATGTSWKTAVHFAQEILSGGNFQEFDYGSHQNQKIYGTETPPQYDLSKVTLPITLFWANNDLLSSEKDVIKLIEILPPATTENYHVPFPEFNHLDYLWAIDAPILLNNQLLSSLRKAFEGNIFSTD